MKKKGMLLTCTLAVLATVASAQPGYRQGTVSSAQPAYRRATVITASDPAEGRCTVSVVVPGAADVELRGDNAVLRTVAGPPPEWQRFECTSPLPYSSTSLQLRAIEGNGKLTMTRDSSAGNVAVVRITNPDPSDSLYTFDVVWRPERSYTSNTADRLVMEDESIQSCQNAFEDRIVSDGFSGVQFGAVSKDDHYRTDWVSGTATASRGYGSNIFSFSCRVDPTNGRVSRLDVTRR
jgi:hypothetical protein